MLDEYFRICRVHLRKCHEVIHYCRGHRMRTFYRKGSKSGHHEHFNTIDKLSMLLAVKLAN